MLAFNAMAQSQVLFLPLVDPMETLIRSFGPKLRFLHVTFLWAVTNATHPDDMLMHDRSADRLMPHADERGRVPIPEGTRSHSSRTRSELETLHVSVPISRCIFVGLYDPLPRVAVCCEPRFSLRTSCSSYRYLPRGTYMTNTMHPPRLRLVWILLPRGEHMEYKP